MLTEISGASHLQGDPHDDSARRAAAQDAAQDVVSSAVDESDQLVPERVLRVLLHTVTSLTVTIHLLIINRFLLYSSFYFYILFVC